jgi:HSP20 family protein
LPATWSPAVAITQDATEVVMSFELAGFSREMVEIALHQNILTVSGFRPSPDANGQREMRLLASERRFGPFRRSIALPLGVNPAEITAQLRDGLLEIRAPRAQQRQSSAHAIPIQ